MDKQKLKLINQILKESEADGEPVTLKEAEAMAEMELKAKGIKNYVNTEKSSKKGRTKHTIEDQQKIDIINFIYQSLKNCQVINAIDIDKPIDFTDVKIANKQREITFNINNENYSITLIKHRKNK